MIPKTNKTVLFDYVIQICLFLHSFFCFSHHSSCKNITLICLLLFHHYSDKNDDKNYREVKRGGQATDNPAGHKSGLELGNRYSALGNN